MDARNLAVRPEPGKSNLIKSHARASRGPIMNQIRNPTTGRQKRTTVQIRRLVGRAPDLVTQSQAHMLRVSAIRNQRPMYWIIG